MYRVKLTDKSSDEITVDGITITHSWQHIKEKTKALEELEKEGKIIIEKVKAVEHIRTKYPLYQDLQEEIDKILGTSSTRHMQEVINEMLANSSARHLQEVIKRLGISKNR